MMVCYCNETIDWGSLWTTQLILILQFFYCNGLQVCSVQRRSLLDRYIDRHSVLCIPVECWVSVVGERLLIGGSLLALFLLLPCRNCESHSVASPVIKVNWCSPFWLFERKHLIMEMIGTIVTNLFVWVSYEYDWWITNYAVKWRTLSSIWSLFIHTLAFST